VRLLSEVLLPKQNSSLHILYLSKNMISDNGIKYLSEMLQTNETLKELWLSHNEISNEGVKQLANVLAYKNKTLKFLSLSMNKFMTDLSINYLIEMLEHNQILKKFWMKDCNLTEQGKIKLHQIVDKKKKFKIEL
jgi:Ran GTPase-activating protein (RanGAP) involved in mRNA processing and transport